VLTDKTFEELLMGLYESDCKPDGKIKAMRGLSHYFSITAMQMRTMLGNFPTAEQRSDIFVIFFLRIVDIENAKLFTVRFEKQEERTMLMHRLGFAVFFPFLQPENQRFFLGFAQWDQRVCMSMLVKLSNVEKVSNIRDPIYTRGDGTVDPLTLGVPRSWESISALPADGTFSCTYVCAPEDRKFETRKMLSQQYSYFNTQNVLEDHVSWWTGLTEPPEDVLDFLEFIIGYGFPNAGKCFEFIDGVGGNGVITLREFEEGVEEMKCHKFVGKTATERIHGIFRYLDPGGEGSVSREEWGVMGQLWQEFELSVREFVDFLVRVFGPDLHVAWEYLDESGDGELDEDEWMQAVDRIGYFGPAKVVFGLLDNSDDGNISEEEFLVLIKYLPKDAKKSKKKQKFLDRQNSNPDDEGSSSYGTSPSQSAPVTRPVSGAA
jgi:Ca2+-binding EF-hand superfamily protein